MRYPTYVASWGSRQFVPTNITVYSTWPVCTGYGTFLHLRGGGGGGEENRAATPLGVKTIGLVGSSGLRELGLSTPRSAAAINRPLRMSRLVSRLPLQTLQRVQPRSCVVHL